MTVVDMGFSGFNTSRALSIIDSVYPRTKPTKERSAVPVGKDRLMWPERDNTFPSRRHTLRLVTIFFGTNDAQLKGGSNSNPIDRYREELTQLVTLLQNPGSDYYSPSTRIIVISPPPIGDLIVQTKDVERQFSIMMANNNTRLYANTAKDVAHNTDVAFINLYDEIESRINSSPSSSRKPFGGYKDYLVDGVHLSAGGNDLLYKLIVDTVNSTWPEIMPGLAPGPAGPTSSIPLQPAST